MEEIEKNAKIEIKEEKTSNVSGFRDESLNPDFKVVDTIPFVIDFANKKIIVIPSQVSAKLDLDMNSSVGAGGSLIQRVITFTNADATPSIKNANICITTGTTAITDFDDGVVGQTITIQATGNITITNGTPILLSGAGNFAMTANDTLTLTMFTDQVWVETSRSVN